MTEGASRKELSRLLAWPGLVSRPSLVAHWISSIAMLPMDGRRVRRGLDSSERSRASAARLSRKELLAVLVVMGSIVVRAL